MAKLIDDPKVAELVAKEVTKATNAERKRINAIIAERKRGTSEITDRDQKKLLKDELTEITNLIKEA